MDRATFGEKVDSMMPDIMNGIREKCNQLYDSGAVNTDDYEDDFLLPKMCIIVALENQAAKYSPSFAEYKNVIRNLRHF